MADRRLLTLRDRLNVSPMTMLSGALVLGALALLAAMQFGAGDDVVPASEGVGVRSTIGEQAQADARPPGEATGEVSGDAARAGQVAGEPRDGDNETGERVEADVSTRSVAITSSFTGVEIVVFGAVVNADADTAGAQSYDIVVIIEGASQRLVARKKNRVGGIWVNTQSITFEDVPSYYAIYTTRPLDEIADPFVLRQNDIGFERIRMRPVQGWETGMTSGGLADFRASVVRLKMAERRYVQDPFGVSFVGSNLFRATVDLPANVPVGPLRARVQLFRDGVLRDTFETVVKLERQGLERWLYSFAFNMPLLYGIFTVLVAVSAGLLASTLVSRFRRS